MRMFFKTLFSITERTRIVAKKKQRWFFYDLYRQVSKKSHNYICAISSVRLPRRTNKYDCAGFYSNRLNQTIMVGMTADIIFGDPRFLKRCRLVEKGISKMPEEFRNIIYESRGNWTTWKWNGHLVFLHANQIALAKDAIIKH